MKLVNRVSMYFLAAMAILLVLYSAIFYVLIRNRLVHQFEQELHSALNSLVAAVEVEPEEVKWQPLEHTIALGAQASLDEVRWAVIGDRKLVVDQSRNCSPELIAQTIAIASNTSALDSQSPAITGQWRFLSKRLAAAAPVHLNRELDEFDEITVVVAQSTALLNANLNRLLLLVCVLPLAAWLAAAVVGRSLCRRALQPVSDMARRARSTSGGDFRLRLPVGNAKDELSDLAVAFNTVLERQHRAYEQQRRFAGDAAHELRTPLTVLLGQIEVALRRSRSPEQYAATLALLRERTVQLQEIVESLLFLARAGEDAALPDLETLAIAPWLAEYVDRWNDHPRRPDLRLRIDAPSDAAADASRALLTRLLDNLVENAFKYSQPGSEVTLALAADASQWSLAVIDHGIGIAADDLPEIFHPFFRSRAARNANIAGAGLGLAIAARIAGVLGGGLECESGTESGTRFTLKLPRNNDQAPPR